jgi:ABC-2 type transport system permease protein
VTLILALSLGGGAVGPFVPWAIPTLQTLGFTAPGAEVGSLNVISYLILGLAGFGGLVGTLAWWRYADQR